MSRCLHFKLSVLGVLRDHILRVTQLGLSREYSRITQLFIHALLGNSSAPGVLRDNSSVASVNGVYVSRHSHVISSMNYMHWLLVPEMNWAAFLIVGFMWTFVAFFFGTSCQSVFIIKTEKKKNPNFEIEIEISRPAKCRPGTN